MACLLSTGREVPCKSAFGGIKSVYLGNFGTMTVTLDATTKEATLVDPPSAWYEYDLKGTSSLETTVTSSRDNGTTFYTQTVNLSFTFLEAKTQNELQLMALGRPYVVVEDYYGNQMLCGLNNGMEVTTGTTVTGAAAGDFSGFTMTLEGMEEQAPFFLAAAVTGDNAQIVPTPTGVPPIIPAT